MRFLADENIEKAVVAFIKSKGYEVYYIAESSPSITDAAVLEYANSHDMVVITSDKDFGEMLYRKRKISCGLLLVRSRVETAESKVGLVRAVLEKAEDKLKGHFVVVSEKGLRIRPL